MNIFLGITGASGFMYTEKLVKELLNYENILLHISATNDALTNINIEKNTNYENIETYFKKFSSNKINIYDSSDFSSPVASGSYLIDYYLVAPASMGFVGRLANGISSNLIERAMDVALKENRNCMILFREMPLNQIHLENLLKLSKAGVKILPASPGFYHQPDSIDDIINFVVGKVLDNMELENNLFKRWS